MTQLEDLERYARRACANVDTVVARAFRIALGMAPTAVGHPPQNAHGAYGVYDGMAECFGNRRRVRM